VGGGDKNEMKTPQKVPMHKKGFDDFWSLRTIGEGAYGKVQKHIIKK